MHGAGWLSFSTDTGLSVRIDFQGCAICDFPFVVYHFETFCWVSAGTATAACGEELLCDLLTVPNRLFHNCAHKFGKKFATVIDHTKFG